MHDNPHTLAMLPPPMQMRAILQTLPGEIPMDLTNAILRFQTPIDGTPMADSWTLGSGPMLMVWASAQAKIWVVPKPRGFIAQTTMLDADRNTPVVSFWFDADDIQKDALGMWHHQLWDRWCVAQLMLYAPDSFAVAEPAFAARGFPLIGGEDDSTKLVIPRPSLHITRPGVYEYPIPSILRPDAYPIHHSPD